MSRRPYLARNFRSERWVVYLRPMARQTLLGAALAGSALVATTLGWSHDARADIGPLSQQEDVGGDIYLWSADFVGTTVPLIPFSHLGLTDTVFLDAEFPFSSNLDGADNARAGFGNPTVGAHWADEITDKWWLHLGGMASVPLASVDEGDWTRTMFLSAVTMAIHDSYLWLVDYIPITGDFGVEYQPIDPIFVRMSLQPIIAIPIGARGGRAVGTGREAELILQNVFEFEARADVGVGGGVSLLPVHVTTESGDNFQVSMEPFFGYDNDYFFMRVGGRLALDRPLGFGFDQGRVATLHLRLGGHLD